MAGSGHETEWVRCRQGFLPSAKNYNIIESGQNNKLWHHATHAQRAASHDVIFLFFAGAASAPWCHYFICLRRGRPTWCHYLFSMHARDLDAKPLGNTHVDETPICNRRLGHDVIISFGGPGSAPWCHNFSRILAQCQNPYSFCMRRKKNKQN